jgi:hypothetical protein
MPHFFRFPAFLLVSTLVLAGCSGSPQARQAISSSSPAPTTAASPNATPAPETSSAASPSPSEDGQTYQEQNGLFSISFPQGYQYQETGSGIAFVSGDQGFGGSVDFGPAEGSQLSTDQLEEALKIEYEKRLQDVSWQSSAVQPDGSVRVDWVGQDSDGNNLDAISFVEQRGDTIFILNLFGINKAYQTYNSDAEAIVNSYRPGGSAQSGARS